MFRLFSYRLVAIAVSQVVGLTSTAAVRADGLVGYRNNTDLVIVVQSATVVNNVITKRGKPQMLYPGEVALDGLSSTGIRRITIYDPKKPNTPLHEEDVILKKDMYFKIETEAATMPVKGPLPPPKFKLTQLMTPTMPANPNAPKPGMPQPKKPGQ